MMLIKIDRRTLLTGLLGIAATNGLAASHHSVDESVDLWLNERVTQEANVRKPDIVGKVPAGTSSNLVHCAMFLSKTWGLEKVLTDIPSLISKGLISVKCDEAPSYLTEYKEISDYIEALTERVGNKDHALEILSFGEFGEPVDRSTRIGRFRYFVLSEFAHFLIASGGFKRFPPTKNYRGFVAGSFTDADLPYRGLT